jgi:hypothetical protein
MLELAEIERIKLKATYYNNLSVGLWLGGLLIPYLSVVQHLGAITEKMSSGSAFAPAEIQNAIATVFAMALAFYGAKHMQDLAKETILSLKENKDISN